MNITEDEKSRIKSLTCEQVLDEWGMNAYGDCYVRCEIPNNQPFALMIYKDEHGEECEDSVSSIYFHDEYIMWLSEHTVEGGRILTNSEFEKSLRGKSLGQIIDGMAKDRREDGSILKKSISERRDSMLTVQKLMDYLKTQNPNACIMAYEPNSFAYIEQWPDLPNDSIRTVKEDIESKRDFYLNQWFKDMPDKEKRCEDEIAETYRYCKDDDVIIKF